MNLEQHRKQSFKSYYKNILCTFNALKSDCGVGWGWSKGGGVKGGGGATLYIIIEHGHSELLAQFYKSGLGCITLDFWSHGNHMIMTSLETMKNPITSSKVSKLTATICHRITFIKGRCHGDII